VRFIQANKKNVENNLSYIFTRNEGKKLFSTRIYNAQKKN